MTAPLSGWTLDLPSMWTSAGAHAAELAALLGAAPAPSPSPSPGHGHGCEREPAPTSTGSSGPGRDLAAWASSGAMALTGRPDGPPLAPAVPLVPRLDGVLAVLRAVAAARGWPFGPEAVGLDAGGLLGERAAAAGLARGGRRSVGGAARLVPTSDGWLAVNLARRDDAELVAAWLKADVDSDDPWPATEALLAKRRGRDAADRAGLLGLPVAEVAGPRDATRDVQATARGQRFPFAPFLLDGAVPRRQPHPLPHPHPLPLPLPASLRHAEARTGPFVVVDLSSLWAGPLCAHLLGLAGATVVKVESVHRLDGARRGPAAFYDLLHAGHDSVTVDLRTDAGRAALRHLIAQADVVVEASRPRALDQLGLSPGPVLERQPGLTWISITGYGRTGPWSGRPAFGDDAAAAAGAVAVAPDGEPVFLADAVADPVTGVVAATAALACVAGGGGHHVDVALREAVGSLLGGRPTSPEADQAARRAPGGTWQLDLGDGTTVPVAPPRLRTPAGRARPAGADNLRLLGNGPR